MVKCKICKLEFRVKPYFLKKGWGKYCSRKCHHEAMKNGKIFLCWKCGKSVYRSDNKVNHSKSGKYFCSKSCQTKWRNEYFSGERHSNWIYGQSAYRGVLIRQQKEVICKRCKSDNRRVLVVHHIDRNRKNNTASNLMWLCRNCHFLIHHDKVEDEKLMEVLV